MASPSRDHIHYFFAEAHVLTSEAKFVINALPNAEMRAVESLVHKLYAVRSILRDIDDTNSNPDELEHLGDYVESLIRPLETFVDSPPPAPSTKIPIHHTGQWGRPAYVLDLDRAILLHNLGLSWESIAHAMGCTRQTIYNHLEKAGLYNAKEVPHTSISDTDLDEKIASIADEHPFIGSAIALDVFKTVFVELMHLEFYCGGEILSSAESIKFEGQMHSGIKTEMKSYGRGASGFMAMLTVTRDSSSTLNVAQIRNAIATFGWPSRVRGDFGTENNGIEMMMVDHWGAAHKAYIRGQSTHNVRIERLWRDIRKDTLEAYRKIFRYLENNKLLDMSDNIQRLCLYVVFHPRIQQSLRRTADAWNHHQIRTAGHKTPIALYELSREHAKTRGYWTGDPGDNVETASHPSYGLEDELEQGAPGDRQVSEEDGDDIRVNENEDITDVHSILTGMGFDIEQEDGNWGIEVYCEAVLKLKVYVETQL
ncbi:hypothetical protein F5879DRAFT_924467 [Lentinula edodes]|nr:hypothetical protein F5879DRAFT_924467 [Lentinula edodes]